MKVQKIYYAERFEKLFKELPENVKRRSFSTQKRFQENPLHPSLRTHKLEGKLEGRWSISIDRRYRILFRVLDDGDILFISIGTHSIYDR